MKRFDVSTEFIQEALGHTNKEYTSKLIALNGRSPDKMFYDYRVLSFRDMSFYYNFIRFNGAIKKHGIYLMTAMRDIRS